MDTPGIKKQLLYHLRQLRPLVSSNCSDDEDEAAFHEMERLVAMLPNEPAPTPGTITTIRMEQVVNAALNHPYTTAPPAHHPATDYADGWRNALEHVRVRLYRAGDGS